jgi:hypothetical protein
VDINRYGLDASPAAISLQGRNLSDSLQTRFLAGKLRIPVRPEKDSGRLIMAHFERIRDVVSGPFSPEVIRQRTAAGWQMVSIEWRRELPESEAPTQGAFTEDIPYGLRISDDCQRLEIDPIENRTLTLMMELLVQDFPYSSIVSDLNEKGLRMRNGKPWNRVAVFNMTPRLIEVGPRLFSTEEWARVRQRLSDVQRASSLVKLA